MKRQLLLVGLVLLAPLIARGFPSGETARVCGSELVFDSISADGTVRRTTTLFIDGRTMRPWTNVHEICVEIAERER